MGVEDLLQHASFVRALARRLLFDPQAADDAAQETWVVALTRPPRHRTNLKAWLARVVRNHVRTMRRAQGRRGRHEAHAARDPREPAAADLAQRAEMQRGLADLVAGLDEPYRDVVVLRYFDGLKPRAIARRLSLPVETVRTRLKRALALLRGRLDDGCAGDRRRWMLALLPLALPTPAAALALGVALPGGLIVSWKQLAAAAALLLALSSPFVFRAFGDPAAATPAKSAPATARTEGPAVDAPADAGTPERAGADATYVHRGRVLTPEREPVAGAEIELFDYTDGTTTRARSDAEGRFTLRSANPSDTRLFIRHPEYWSWYAGIAFQAEGETEYVVQRGAPVRVAVTDPEGRPVAGATVALAIVSHGFLPSERRVHLGTYVLATSTTDARGAWSAAAPEGAIVVDATRQGYARASKRVRVEGMEAVAVTITLDAGKTVSGTVRDGAGKPVAGATVFTVEHETTADDEGRYALEHLSGGGYEVWAEAGVKGVGYYGRTLGWGDPVPVEAGSTDVDIALSPPAWIGGRVVDDRGEPLAGINVRVWTRHRGHFPAGRTDDLGHFRVGPVGVWEDAIVNVHFDTDHYASYGTRHVALKAVEDVRIRPGAEVDIGVVRGTRRGSVHGRVVFADGRAAPGGGVTSRGEHNTHAETPILPDGRFRFRFAGPGVVRLRARLWSDTVQTSDEVEVEIGPGETVEDVELVLRPLHALTGRVRGPEGRPHANMTVMAVPAGAEPPYEAHARETTFTDAQGRFRFSLAGDGEHRVGLANAPALEMDFLSDPAPVTARPGDDVELEYDDRGATVTGRVVDDRDGSPVERYAVLLMRYDWFVPRHAQSEWGSDRFIMRVPGASGTYAVEIRADGYAPQRTATFALAKGDAKDAGTIRLRPAGSIEITVRDAAGAPVPHARVHAIGAKLEADPDAPFTGADGRCRLLSLAPGAYNVFVVSPRHPIGIARGVEVKSGDRAKVDLHLEAAAPVTIRVEGPGGAPVPNARLVYTFPALAPLDSRLAERYEPITFGANRSDAEGRIEKPYLPPGELSLQVSADGFETAARTVTRAAGETTEIVVRLRAR